jgi:hypothetical protein
VKLRYPNEPYLNLKQTQQKKFQFNILKHSVQLNEYETVPYFLQSSQKLTSDCLMISVFLPVFALSDHNIVLQIKTKQFYDHNHAKTGKNTEINKQSDVKFWLY